MHTGHGYNVTPEPRGPISHRPTLLPFKALFTNRTEKLCCLRCMCCMTQELEPCRAERSVNVSVPSSLRVEVQPASTWAQRSVTTPRCVQ